MALEMKVFKVASRGLKCSAVGWMRCLRKLYKAASVQKPVFTVGLESHTPQTVRSLALLLRMHPGSNTDLAALA